MMNNFQPQVHHRVQSNCLETLETSPNDNSKKNKVKVTLPPLLHADPRGFWQIWKGGRINELCDCGNRKQLRKCTDSPLFWEQAMVPPS